MDVNRRDYILRRIAERKASRDWAATHQGFEIDAVRALRAELTAFMRGRDCIGERCRSVDVYTFDAFAAAIIGKVQP